MRAAEYPNIRTAVHDIAAFNGAGRYVCPKCNGGTDREESLSIRVDAVGGVHWRCFRAQCGTSGGPRGVGSVFAKPKKEARHFTRPIKPLTDPQRALLFEKFGDVSIEAQVHGYSYGDDRFILGVYGPTGYNRRGVVAYSFNQKPKSLTYNEKPDEPFIHFSGVWGLDRDLVIVEDWFSAEKVAATGIARGVAILGTHLDQEMVTEIAGLGARTWIALDRDAYAKTLGYVNKYREQFGGGLFAWSLARDLKYETTDRIKEALVDGKTNFIEHVGKQGNA
jgi:hypothetical protein